MGFQGAVPASGDRTELPSIILRATITLIRLAFASSSADSIKQEQPQGKGEQQEARADDNAAGDQFMV